MNSHITQYKDWQSPIPLNEVFAKPSSPAFLEAKNDCLYWMEQNPQQSGLTQVICRTAQGDLLPLTSTEFNVRTRANEYGGKAFCVGDDALYFCNDADQRIYRQAFDSSSAQALTIDNQVMYADLTLSHDGKWLFFVMEKPQSPENLTQIGVIPTTLISPIQPKNLTPSAMTIVESVEQDEKNKGSIPIVLASGSDFYASLTLSSNSSKLAWIEWMHPNMPWDKTRAVIADLELPQTATITSETSDSPLTSTTNSTTTPIPSPKPIIRTIDLSLDQAVNAKGAGATIAHLQYGNHDQLFMTIDWPHYSNNEIQNFAQLYCWNGESLNNISHTRDEYSYPHWIYGNHRYVHIAFSNTNTNIKEKEKEKNNQNSDDYLLAIASNQWGDELHHIDLVTQEMTRLAENFVRFTHICEDQGIAYVVAETTTSSFQVLKIIGDQVAASPSPEKSLSDTNISHAQSITIDTLVKNKSEQEKKSYKSHAFYYPPKNMRYSSGSAQENLPPLVVMVHGGPTARAQNHFDIQKQFWTTSGFAVLDVNHRGSTGFGRHYRDALLGQWGVADADDIYVAIDNVLNKKMAHPRQVFIRGKSAGGYAVQRALTLYPDIFAAGASYYGIGDLATLASITHKFERRYCDQLLGEVYDPETAKLPLSAYHQRSPINYMNNIKCPLILFQGLDDKVVPPTLSQQVVDVLESLGLEYEYHKYAGEGHGFRNLTTQVDSLSKELSFYKRQIIDTK